MPKKFRLLLVDANVVIHAHAAGFWSQLLDCCDIHLSETVVGQCLFYEDTEGIRHDIDLQPAIGKGNISVHAVSVKDLQAFRAHFGTLYQQKLDDGEMESLAILFGSNEGWLIASADKIVFRILGSANRGEQGVSLEEILQKTGLARSLPKMFSKDYRDQWTRKGFEENLYGLS